MWPESKDYWDDDANRCSIFDVFYTDNKQYSLRCLHCGRSFIFHIKYFHHRKSLIPCECECKAIEKTFREAIKLYAETGDVVILDDSLQCRRLYDRMAWVAFNIWRCESTEEAEMYKKMGFDNPYIDVYLSRYTPK